MNHKGEVAEVAIKQVEVQFQSAEDRGGWCCQKTISRFSTLDRHSLMNIQGVLAQNNRISKFQRQ